MSITEIRMRRDTLNGAGWSFVVRGDGMASEHRARGPRPAAILTGTVDARDVRSVAALIESNGFFDLDDQYGERRPPLTEIGVIRGGVSKTVLDYCDDAPHSLHVIRRAIFNLRMQVDWNVTASPEIGG